MWEVKSGCGRIQITYKSMLSQEAAQAKGVRETTMRTRYRFTAILLLLSFRLLQADPERNMVTELGLSLGYHGGLWIEKTEGNITYHSSEIRLLGFSLDMNPAEGDDYIVTLRTGVSGGDHPTDRLINNPTSYLFAGSKSLFRMRNRSLPVALFFVSSPHDLGAAQSIGSFHHFVRKYEIFNNQVFSEISVPIQISPLIAAQYKDQTHLSFGVISVPSIRIGFGRFSFGYDAHLGYSRSYSGDKNIRLFGWQVTGNWKI